MAPCLTNYGPRCVVPPCLRTGRKLVLASLTAAPCLARPGSAPQARKGTQCTIPACASV